MNKNSFVLLITLAFLLILGFHFESSRAQVTVHKVPSAQRTFELSRAQQTQASRSIPGRRVQQTAIDYGDALKIATKPSRVISESSEAGSQYLTAAQPNLTPIQLTGWSDKLMVSNMTGTNTDSSVFGLEDTLYVDWAVINDGDAVAGGTFFNTVYVDGVQRASWFAESLNSGSYVSVSDFQIDPLSEGSHTIKIVADATGTISESSEADNEYTKTINVVATNGSNLTPYQPSGWSDKIVVANTTGTTTDSTELRTTDTLLVDWAITNNGNVPTGTTFFTTLYIDGAQRASWCTSPPLAGGGYRTLADYSIGNLSAGSHLIKIVSDSTGVVAESNEADNEYSKTITVTQAPTCYTLITGANPAGGGTVTSNVVPNCSTGVDTFANNLTPAPPTAMAGENPWGASRSLAMEEVFDKLIAQAEAGGPLGVIIGLKVRYQPEAMIIRPEAIKRQRADVARSQNAVLARLIDYDPATVKKYFFIPAMALRASKRDLRRLKASPDVVTIEEDAFLKPSLSESVPLVGAPAAWASGFSGFGQTVAILDSGVDKTHPFLFGKVLSEACYSLNLCPGGVRSSTSPGSGVNCSLPILSCSHGTHVAGIAAGNGTSFSGVARDAGIISIQVFSQTGDAQIGAYDSDLLLGLQRVQELSGSFPIAAVNMSLVGSTYASNCDFVDPTLKAGIDALRALNIATVVAAGNNGLANSLTSPACISSAISVGATGDGSGSTGLDLLAGFSNNAGFLNLLAPGDEILSSVPGGNFENHSGTSMAAPHVAGAWAILKSKFPSASVDQVLGALAATGKPVTDSRNGITKPRIQVDAAVNSLGSSGFQYSPGTMVTLTATPASNHTFQSWTGCDSVAGLNCTLTMSANRSVTANFTPITRALTVTSNRDIGVTVITSDNSGSGRLFVPFSRSITLNASVTLIAPPTMGIGIFKRWQRDGVDWALTQSTTLTMDDNHTMTAVYENPIVKLQFGATNYEVNEGSASIAVEVTRTGFTSGTASVLVGSSDGTASQAKDYTLAGGRVSFADGETSKTFTVLITDDLYVEPNETINLSLANPLASSAVPELGSPNSATVTIVDNDITAPTSNPLDNADARFFVRQHYSDFLSRVPDTSGYDFWSGQITQCGSDLSCRKDKLTDVSNAFYFEPEFQQTGAYVYRLYRIAFGNNQPFPNPNSDPAHPGEEKKWPLYASFMKDRAQVRGGPQLSQMQFDLAKAFVGRSEFRAKYPYNFANPIPFIDALLNTINRDLGVNLSSQRTNLINLTVTGPEPGPAYVMYSLALDKATERLDNRALLDAEYNRAFVFTQYAGYLRRDADIAGLLFWLEQVDSTPLRDIARQHAMVCSFITSAEYQRRFSSTVTRNNTECPQ